MSSFFQMHDMFPEWLEEYHQMLLSRNSLALLQDRPAWSSVELTRNILLLLSSLPFPLKVDIMWRDSGINSLFSDLAAASGQRCNEMTSM